VSSEPTKADTSDMAAVHAVFRGAVDAAPKLIGEVADGDSSRAAVVASYYHNVLRLLDVHHQGEDLLVTPLLADRSSAEDAKRAQEIANQHNDVHAPLAEAEAAVDQWAKNPDSASRARAVEAVQQLGAILVPHLDVEEEFVVPLAALHLSAEEWGQLPQHGMQNFSGDNVWLVVGLIRESMTDEQRQAMLDSMPPPVSEAWRNVGQAEFEVCIAEIRTTA
jgi:hypothetical protein